MAHAIWFTSEHKHWVIGSLSKIGNETGGIYSNSMEMGKFEKESSIFDVPHDTWNYNNGTTWQFINSSDIEINCHTGISF